MTRTIDDIYQSIAQGIVDSIDEEWVEASAEVFFDEGVADLDGYFKSSLKADQQSCRLDFSILDDFEDLLEVMNTEGKHPWVKARFTLKPTGKFDLDFTYQDELSESK